VDTFHFDEAYYRANYKNYHRQNPRRKFRYYQRCIQKHWDSALPRRIHDIGCAFGAFLGSLDESWEICGSDASEFAIRHARQAHPQGHFRVADASDGTAHSCDPCFARPFGVVTAFDVLEHIPRLSAVVASVQRQLAERGLFVFVVPVYDGLSGPVIRLLDRDPTHVHKWPRQRWLDWARASFDLIHWSGTMRYLIPLAKYYLHWPTRLFRGHTPAITVICRRKPFPANANAPAAA